MRLRSIRVVVVGTLGLAAVAVATQPVSDRAAGAAERAAHWLARVQGQDGGWGQDGGETSFARTGERLETQANDVANTAVATLALLRVSQAPARGQLSPAVRRGVEFISRHIEASPEDGLAVTPMTGTQIQRKLGPYIDTFLSSMLLSELDGNMGDAASNRRVRAALEKCVRKIQKHQQADGSWNHSGGWAPILGTSMASRSLDAARQKGVRVEASALARVDEYTKSSAKAGGVAGGVPGGVRGGIVAAVPAAAGVPLYQSAQQLEQLSRTADDREKNAKEIRAIAGQLSRPEFVRGFGSMGGEEFFSYLNISDSMRRSGGTEWTRWNGQIKTNLVELQNQDGTWAGHHCITGRVAVTSAAVLTLLADREPAVIPTAARGRK